MSSCFAIWFELQKSVNEGYRVRVRGKEKENETESDEVHALTSHLEKTVETTI